MLKVKFVAVLIGSLAISGCFDQLRNFFEHKDHNQKLKLTQTTLSETMKTIDRFHVDCKRLPTSLEELAATPPPAECKTTGRYLKKVPIDGWGNRIVMKTEIDSVTLLSLGADGAEGGIEDNLDIVEKRFFAQE